jgi:dihydroorotate dehydrogenase subfamily 1
MRLEEIRGRHLAEAPLLATVSGIASTAPAMIDWFARNTCAHIVTTKSIERVPNPGNREPVITEPRPGCFGNAVGLRNPGVDVALAELRALREGWQTSPPRVQSGPLLNVSLSAASEGDFVALARALSPVADLLELNFSCPHAAAGYGATIGSSAAAIRLITRAVTEEATVPVFVKLTPNVEDIAAMAAVAVEAGADGIVAINTAGPERYIDPASGKPILTNAPGGRGGMSGAWVYEGALEAVASIRRALGPGVPLVGMGGVSTAKQFREMHRAGADVVGIGSALGTLHQRDWPAFLQSLQRKEAVGTAVSGPLLGSPGHAETARSRMSYTRITLARVDFLEPTIAEVTMEETIESGPGQTVFLWIPEIGEKPFAVASTGPAVFVVKVKGAFTRALVALPPGSALYVRGPYGDRHVSPEGRILMVAAGTGIAAISVLAVELLARGTDLRILLGMRDSRACAPLASDRALQAVTEVVHDRGVVGRVLDVFSDALAAGPAPTVVYTVGPEPFMKRARALSLGAGLPPDRIFLCLERTMLCGVGLCGACGCRGALTCQYGTFVDAGGYDD